MSIYEVDLFQERGFQRKKCVNCGRHFWTVDPDRETCGDTPCDEYTFIDNSPIEKNYTLPEMEEEFLSFFDENDHEAISRYPVVARWRDDIHLTIASIADFQPWVTSGEVPPPANPLVVSQPSIRLNDIDNVGRSGRHFTLFFMGGHHAFNSQENSVYWNNETVRLCHEFLTDSLGIDPAEITYVEDFWEGGGNAGEDFEVNVRGLELATLVFMQYGFENGERYELPLQIVDTGYGMERLVWASQGSPTSYEAVFGPMISRIKDIAEISLPPEEVLEKNSKLAGLMDIETGRDLKMLRSKVSEETGIEVDELDEMLVPLENVYAVADHLRCLAFMFGDGITPSNEGEGYLSRLVLRRTLRLMNELGIDESLSELMDREIDHLGSDYPEIRDKEDYILKVVELEEKRYRETLDQGKKLVTRITSSLKEKGEEEMPTEDLIELYDSNGLPPEVVKEVAETEGIEVETPEDFYTQVAESHSHLEETAEEETKISKFFDTEELSKTEALYYTNPYQKEFEANILQTYENYVVLNKTAFYPEGGGQPADKGVLKIGDEEVEVTDVQKEDDIIFHELKNSPAKWGDTVKGKIDWNRRSSFMRHHTATHILLGALRTYLGNHVYQHGVQKGKESSRLDVTHYERLSEEDLKQIEKLANQIVFENRDVKAFWMDRNEAEQKYGHSLYQGGVVPGEEIRVVDIQDWNAQACAGTHCTSTGEVGLIKIIGRERIQDGVERLIFASGNSVLEALQEQEERLKKAANTLRAEPGEIDKAVEKIFEKWKSSKKEADLLRSRLADLLSKDLSEKAEELDKGLEFVSEVIESSDMDELVKIGEKMTKNRDNLVVILGSADDSAQVVAMAGDEALEKGVDCGKIISNSADILGGGGGGRPEMGQGGGSKVEKLDRAIKEGVETLKEQVRENG